MPAMKELQTYVIGGTVAGISWAVLRRYLFPLNKLAGAISTYIHIVPSLMNMWSYTFYSPYMCMTWGLISHFIETSILPVSQFEASISFVQYLQRQARCTLWTFNSSQTSDISAPYSFEGIQDKT
jgi:hypothetical protein